MPEVKEVKPGMLIRNNDPRHDWTTPVLRVTATHAIIQPRRGGRVCSVSFKRIYHDGGRHHQGYNVVDHPGDIGHPVQMTSGADRVAQAHVEGLYNKPAFA